MKALQILGVLIIGALFLSVYSVSYAKTKTVKVVNQCSNSVLNSKIVSLTDENTSLKATVARLMKANSDLAVSTSQVENQLKHQLYVAPVEVPKTKSESDECITLKKEMIAQQERLSQIREGVATKIKDLSGKGNSSYSVASEGQAIKQEAQPEIDAIYSQSNLSQSKVLLYCY